MLYAMPAIIKYNNYSHAITFSWVALSHPSPSLVDLPWEGRSQLGPGLVLHLGPSTGVHLARHGVAACGLPHLAVVSGVPQVRIQEPGVIVESPVPPGQQTGGT